jgi:threonine/homoserine/homoserine lactone efflux protein
MQPRRCEAPGLAPVGNFGYKPETQMLVAALLGFAFGFVFSIPVAGPVSILVFGRGLEDRVRSGVYLAVGGALAESMYAYLAFWGFSELFALHPWLRPISRGVTAAILLGLGIHFMRKQSTASSVEPKPDPNVGNKRSFLLGVTVTALNPTLVATWSAAATFIHSWNLVDLDSNRALPFSVGVCLGISGWFVVLLLLLRRFRGRFEHSTLDRVVRTMGLLVVLFGLAFAVSFVLDVLSFV